jgi:Protein of unknown function (DUF4242)
MHVTHGHPARADVTIIAEPSMPTFVIERNIPGAGKLSDQEIQSISTKSNGVLADMNAEGTPIEWVQSYVSGDKIYCVYNAPNEQAVREHAQRGGFPANSISAVGRIIDPSSAQSPNRSTV